jgi:integrase
MVALALWIPYGYRLGGYMAEMTVKGLLGGIKSARVTKTPTWIRDGGARGGGQLIAKVTSRGASFYFDHVNGDKKRDRIPLGPFTEKPKDGFLTLDEGRDKAREFSAIFRDTTRNVRQHLEQKKTNAAEAERIAKMEQAALKTFIDIFMDWNTVKLSKRKDGAEMLRAVGKDVLPVVGHMEMGTVARADLMGCLDAVAARAPVMANRVLTTLKTFYGWAQLREIVTTDPLGPVKAADVGGKEPGRKRVLSDAEIMELFRKLPECGISPRVQTALLISLASGCRIGEIAKAEWAHVSMARKAWFIPAENAKNGEEHNISLSPFAMVLFESLQATRENRWIMAGVRDITTGADGATDKPCEWLPNW